ncbi:MAG TPA: tetratricopeptide repeat protein, partial [Candidatus Aminicenantes bacterium]|nr:tetratricopeptide repeat protein [Candidatus Aminicenantes bacterium]
EVPMDGLAPNAYFVSVNLVSQGIPLQVKEKEFSVSPLGNVPEPGVAFKMIPLENRYIYFQMVGGLARSIGKKDKALESFRKAWEICPVKEKLAKEYALFLLESGNGAEALSVIENLKGSEREKFEYLSIRGRALALLGKDVEALESMLAANKIYDSDTDLLNDMGRLFLKIGNKEEAVKVLKASLKLKKEQPETEALLKSIQ